MSMGSRGDLPLHDSDIGPFQSVYIHPSSFMLTQASQAEAE